MFKYSKGKKKSNKENAVDANQVISDMEQPTSKSDEIETVLSIPNDWNMTDEERYVYAFHNSESPKLKTNQISIYGMELMKKDDNHVTVTGLIRSSVIQPILFEKTSILLLDKDGKYLAKREFDLGRLGELPSNSSRPWEFEFRPTDFADEEPVDIADGWSLAFELKKAHHLDLEPSWEKSLDDKSKEVLRKIVAEAPVLKENEVNLMGVKADYNEKGDLAVTILIRNGNEDKNITLEQLPLKLIDATETEVVRGVFKLEDLTVKANTSKPWTFIFPKSTIKSENPDFSRWKVIAIQN